MFGDLTQSEIQTHNLYIHVIHVLQHQPYCCIIHGDEIKVVFFFKQLIFITSTLWRLSLIKKTFETLIFSVDVTSFWPWTQWFWKKPSHFYVLSLGTDVAPQTRSCTHMILNCRPFPSICAAEPLVTVNGNFTAARRSWEIFKNHQQM